MWSCCAGVTSSDALQEARRAEQEQERAKEFEELRKAKVRPDCVVCCASVTNSDALQEARLKEEVRPAFVVCCAGATMF